VRRPVLLVPLLALCLLLLGAGAAGAVPRDLQIRQADCAGVSVTAVGMPANQQLFLLVRNLANGAVVGKDPTPVQSNGSGTVSAHLVKDLKGIPTVDVSIWTKKGETLTMTARDTASTGCRPAGAVSGSLALTGSASSIELLVGVVLLAVGMVAVWWTRYRPRHARGA
jgi:hypothetical protein